MKKINFVLPANYNRAVGGFKIVYQYANELVHRGNEVSITFLFNMRGKSFILTGFEKTINSKLLKYVQHKNEVTWFNLDKKIKIYYDLTRPQDFPDADVVIATAAPTTHIVSKLSESKGKKYYFIQNFETWFYKGSTERVNETYRLGMTNIVISHELRDKVYNATNKEPEYLPNFYNHEEFFLENPIAQRKNTVSLINHIHDVKRTKLGLEILAEVKKEIPDLTVELFGAYKPITELESYVNFTFNANSKQLRKDIYGKSKIYLLPSVLEGWVLTGMEAMASGATVISSRIGGITDYANDDNSILITPDDKESFVTEIVRILKNDSLRIKLAERALNDVQQYEIGYSTDRLEELFLR